MGNVIRSLMVKVGADVGDFQKKMSYVSKDMRKQAKEMQNLGKSMTQNITIPALAVATGLGALVLKTAEYGDNIEEMSIRTGLSIQDPSTVEVRHLDKSVQNLRTLKPALQNSPLS